jgi:hypothetical protein
MSDSQVPLIASMQSCGTCHDTNAAGDLADTVGYKFKVVSLCRQLWLAIARLSRCELAEMQA